MKKSKKLAAVICVAVFMTILLAQTVAATNWTRWATFRIHSSDFVEGLDINNQQLSATTTVAVPSTATGRRAIVESRNQTMWSTPRVSLRASGFNTDFYNVSNNGSTSIRIQIGTDITYTLRVRSSTFQMTNHNYADFRFSVNNSI